MTKFVYEARKKDGMLVRDTLDAADLREATQHLKEQGARLISIKEYVVPGSPEYLAEQEKLRLFMRVLIAAAVMAAFTLWHFYR